MNKIIETLESNGVLETVYNDIASVLENDPELFTMIRRQGLGASDASIYMGVNMWTTVEQLVEQKQATTISTDEKAIGEKEVVRKGADLEPIILGKFSKAMKIAVVKPPSMYRMIEHPQLTINFDGVIQVGENQLVPVEAKFASTYANKYWDRTKAVTDLFEGTPHICGGASMKEHIEQEASLYGIPPYYYTQIQQQMLGLNAPFGYFAVIFDKGWEFKAFKIFADSYVQNGIIAESQLVWGKVQGKRHV